MQSLESAAQICKEKGGTLPWNRLSFEIPYDDGYWVLPIIEGEEKKTNLNEFNLLEAYEIYQRTRRRKNRENQIFQ